MMKVKLRKTSSEDQLSSFFHTSVVALSPHQLSLHGKVFKHTNGIPQGLVLSTLLCCTTFAHMEHEHFSDFLQDPNGCMMRWIDDYIYISTSMEKMESFLKCISAGYPQYGCHISPNKTAVNFAASIGMDRLASCCRLSFVYPALLTLKIAIKCRICSIIIIRFAVQAALQ